MNWYFRGRFNSLYFIKKFQVDFNQTTVEVCELILKDNIQFDTKQNWFNVERHVHPGFDYRAWVRRTNIEYDILEEEEQKRGTKRKR